jgi:hypothetical protein
MLEKHLAMVERFHQEITGLPIPDGPTFLRGERLSKSLDMLNEEIRELVDATNAGEQADALIDLIYFAYGRLLEMGVRPGPAFRLVHDANMKKVRGANKRGNQFEAMKPEGWRPPDWDWFFGQEIDERGKYIGLRVAEEMAEEELLRSEGVNPFDNSGTSKVKILLLGHGRHGKDTVAEILRDTRGYKFTSSSMFCAEKVMMPAFERETHAFLSTQFGRIDESSRPREALMYATVEDCFADRHNHRAFWFREIEAYNYPDRAKLAKDIYAENDIYVGIRSAKEFNAAKNAGVFDIAIWVDALDRLPPEDPSSISVQPWMADFTIDNNGSLEDLKFNVEQLMETIE